MVASLKPQKSTNSLQPGDPAPLIGLLLWTCNRPFPSPSGPLYQNEVKCSAFEGNDFHSHANKTHFYKKVCSLGLILSVRVFGTRKWLIDYCDHASADFIS